MATSTALEIDHEECVCHWIEGNKDDAKTATAECRVILHTKDGRSFQTVVEIEVYDQD